MPKQLNIVKSYKRERKATTQTEQCFNQGDVHITQIISTTDAAKAATLAINGFTKQLKQAARNTEGIPASNGR